MVSKTYVNKKLSTIIVLMVCSFQLSAKAQVFIRRILQNISW